MRVFVLSDSHGDHESLGKALDFLKDKADLLLFCGDYVLQPYSKEDMEECTTDNRLNRTALRERILKRSEEKYSELEEMLDDTGVPVLMIPGNHERPNYFDFFEDKNIHLESKTLGEVVEGAGALDELVVAGYGGSNETGSTFVQEAFDIKIDFTERELYQHLKASQPDIAVLHNPPKKTEDGAPRRGSDGKPYMLHIGSALARRYMVENTDEGRPRLIVCGHRHTPGISEYRNTLILNAGNLGRYGDVDPETMEIVRMHNYGSFAEVVLDEEGQVSEVAFYSAKEDKVKELQRIELD